MIQIEASHAARGKTHADPSGSTSGNSNAFFGRFQLLKLAVNSASVFEGTCLGFGVVLEGQCVNHAGGSPSPQKQRDPIR